MEAIVARDNLKEALRQVKRNKGINGMTVEHHTPYLHALLQEHWPAIRARLIDGPHYPVLVHRVAGFAARFLHTPPHDDAPCSSQGQALALR
jgi:hypothetical protein